MQRFIILLCTILLFACSEKVTAPMQKDNLTVSADQSFRKKMPNPSPAAPIDIKDYRKIEMDNGLTILLVENHKLPRVSVQIYVNRDPVMDKGFAGFTSITGDLLGRGSKSRSKAEIDQEIDFVGATLNTNSRGASGRALKKHVNVLLDVMSDVLLNPSFDKTEFEKLKGEYISNHISSKDSPDAIAGWVRSSRLFGDNHPNGQLITEKTLDEITLEKCVSFYESYFKPNNSLMVVVGDANETEVKSWAKTYFGKWKSNKVPTHTYTDPPELNKTTVSLVHKPGAVQSVISVANIADLKPGEEDNIVTSLMNTILGHGGFSGRLLQNLREDKAYTYGAFSSLNSDRLMGDFQAGASVRNEVTHLAINEFINEIKRICDEKVSEEELQTAKNIVNGSFSRAMESPQTIANFALNTERYNLPKDYYKTYLQKMDKITVDDIQAIAKKYLRPNASHIIVVGNRDEILDSLSQYYSVKHFNEYGDEIQFVKLAAGEDVTAEGLIQKYISAVGGEEALKGVNDMTVSMKASTQMGEIQIVHQYKDNDKYLMRVMAQGMTVQEQKYNGGTSIKMGGMQGDQVVTDEKMVNAVKRQAQIFGELQYLTEGHSLVLDGIEDVNDSPAFKINITFPNGDEMTDFYDKESGLKVKSISKVDAPTGPQTVILELRDYTEVEGGVMYPVSIKISGAMPMTVEFVLNEILINSGLSDEIFKF